MSSHPPKENLSRTPSWIMVGFVLGVLAVLGFQHETGRQRSAAAAAAAAAPATPPEPVPEVAPNPATLPDRPSLDAIEAVFSEWGRYARWEDDRTEVALWNSRTSGFTDYFEVLRSERGFFFRPLTRLSRPFTEGNPPPESPLRFTEPAAEREARRAGRLKPADDEALEAGPWRTAPASDRPRSSLEPTAPRTPAPGAAEAPKA